MPFGEFENFAECVSQNQDKEDPDAYCAVIQQAIEGKLKDTEWMDVSKWENDRIIETVISAPIKDSQNDLIETTAIANVLPWLTRHGYYEWMHTGFPIGKIIGWRLDGGNAMIRVGIHDTKSSRMKIHDKVWKVIKEMGNRAFSSIKGLPEATRRVSSGSTSFTVIEEIGLYGVGWVGSNPANPEARVTWVNELAKSQRQEVDALLMEINLGFAKAGVEESGRIEGLSQGDSVLAHEMLSAMMEKDMSWEECAAEARKLGAREPDKLCGWLKWHGPGVSKSYRDKPESEWSDEDKADWAQDRMDRETFIMEFGKDGEKLQKMERVFSTVRAYVEKYGSDIPTSEYLFEHCGNCRELVEEIQEVFGASLKTAKSLFQDRLDAIKSSIKIKKANAGQRTPRRNETMSPKEGQEEEAPPEEAPAEEAPPEEAPAEEVERDLAAELDELKALVKTLADAVAVLQGGTQEALEEAGVQAEEVSEAVEGMPPAEEVVASKEAKALEARLEKMEKKVGMPERDPRGVGSDVDEALKGVITKADTDKLASGDISAKEFQGKLGVKR